MSEKFDKLVSREQQVFMPSVRRWPVALERGLGSRVWDVDGREFIDLTAGWGVTSIGHCHPALAEAIADQARTLMQTTNLVYTRPQLDLAERLARLAPGDIHRSFFTSSGAEANEGALKLAARKTGRSRFLSTFNSFHGRTLGVMGCLGQDKYRGPWKGIVREATFVPFGDIDAVRAALTDEYAAMIVEPIQGEGGVVVPPADYLKRVADACHAVGALADRRRGADLHRPHRPLVRVRARRRRARHPDLREGRRRRLPAGGLHGDRRGDVHDPARRPRRHLRGQPARVPRGRRGAARDRGREAGRARRHPGQGRALAPGRVRPARAASGSSSCAGSGS